MQTRNGHLQLRIPVPVREDHGSLVLLGCWHTARRGQWPTSHADVIIAAAGPCRQTTLDLVYRCTRVRPSIRIQFASRLLHALPPGADAAAPVIIMMLTAGRHAGCTAGTWADTGSHCNAWLQPAAKPAESAGWPLMKP